jgi:uncharacterized membrane protein YfcA
MLSIAGFLTGFLVGLTGVGGGALMTPVLLLLFGVAPTTAVGTDLWFAALTKIAAAGMHRNTGLIDWQVVKRLWCGSLPATAVTIVLMKFGALTYNLTFFKVAIAAAVVVTAFGMLFQKRLHALGQKLRLTDSVHFKLVQAPLTVAAGALLGVLVTLTSIGAGALGAVLLTYLYPLRMKPAKLIATDIVHAIPLAMFAGLGHLIIGHVDFALLGWLLSGSVPGVLLGAFLSSRSPQPLLRAVLSAILLVVGAKLLWA